MVRSGNHGYPFYSAFTTWQKIILWLCRKLTPKQMADVYSLYLRNLPKKRNSNYIGGKD